MDVPRLPGLRVRQLANGTTIMMRSISIAAALGLLAALPAVCFLSASRQNPAAMPAGADNAISEAAIPVEAWPICSTTGSMVETADWAALDPDFAAGKRAIVAGDWNGAINALTSAGLRDAAYRHLRQPIRPCDIISRR